MSKPQVIDVGYIVGKALSERCPKNVHRQLLNSGCNSVTFIRNGTEWVGNIDSFPTCDVLEAVAEQFSVDKIVYTTYIDHPDILLEPKGYVSKVLGTAVVKEGVLYYGMSGYK